jgi:hypothetical protein
MTVNTRYTRWPGLVAIYCLPGLPDTHLEAATELLERFNLPYVYQHVDVTLPDELPSQPGIAARGLGLEPNTPRGQLRLFLHNNSTYPSPGWSDELRRITLSVRNGNYGEDAPAVFQGLLLHELGHAFDVVSPHRERWEPSASFETMADPDALLRLWSEHHPEGRVLNHGWHCLQPSCVMQTAFKRARWIEIAMLGTTEFPFCANCQARWNEAHQRFQIHTLPL